MPASCLQGRNAKQICEAVQLRIASAFVNFTLFLEFCFFNPLTGLFAACSLIPKSVGTAEGVAIAETQRSDLKSLGPALLPQPAYCPAVLLPVPEFGVSLSIAEFKLYPFL